MKLNYNGLLVLDKPSGVTSRDVVDHVAKWFPRRTKIGHTGTLDPLATGVLVICVGQATRLAEYVQEMGKTYQTTFVFGSRSDTDDADGTLTPTAGAVPLDEASIRKALDHFIGAIEQTPPAYSAVKIGGQRAHELARRGREFQIEPRTVHVNAIDVQGYCWPELRLQIDCGKGTYIRSLARDLGDRLGCGAYVRELRRLCVGHFQAADGLKWDDSSEEAKRRLLPIRAAVAHLPEIAVDAIEADILRHGQPIPPRDGLKVGSELMVSGNDGELIGVAALKGDGLIWPVKSFPPG